MGKIADALEKQKKDTLIKPETIPAAEPKKLEIQKVSKPIPSEFISPNAFSHKLVVLSAPDSIDAENFKVLRGKILFPKEGERPRIIMVTSAFPGEGKTYVSVNLAVSIALGINEHVLLVDCDLRQPSVHKMLGYVRAEGLVEYLTGKKKLPDLLIRSKIDKLSLLLGGNPTSNPSELLASNEMKEFLEEVKGRYDDRYIIIDSTPSQVTAEANILAHHVDGIVYVVMAKKSPRETIQRSMENLGKEKMLGVVFNGYSNSHRGYDKYYKKYYK